MGTYTRRVQTVLTEEEYRQLQRLARSTGKPVSVLVREAVEREYLAAASPDRRRAALQRLLSLEAPVADWQDMEEEIEAGMVERRDRPKERRG